MIRTIFFFILFWTTMIIWTPFGFILLVLDWLCLGVIARPLISLIVRGWCHMVIWSTGCSVEVIGRENIPKEKKLVFVSNHEGDMDFVLLLAYVPRTVGFIIKHTALYMPFLNIWIAVLGGVFIHRGNIRKARASIEKGAAQVKKGKAVCIYPEGTRSRGNFMREFKPGSFKLATMAEAVIVPVTVNGTWRAWEEHKRITPCKVSIQFHPPIATAGLDVNEKKELPHRVETIIRSGLRDPEEQE
ncbi:MAG TPA: lysophospholipid acyltransferase family protein [Spirochaetia bacterium]|nr:lysophospholipid acyltransferase family protein [Spirochaetales bacterium]HRS65239.1 lysophospholipid acyltransferase family protein [Spirochaetia bacterium]HOT58584.1 lysophospholipid acyltransferase family protein [Spirochaetales bacterium]HPD80227.1 lysophospholipid acyltransferase family protein [Spirochaetales bacterium]HQG39406.1 lysophospholipid acyltransferase family protein [Spirochaetales bacterium]